MGPADQGRTLSRLFNLRTSRRRRQTDADDPRANDLRGAGGGRGRTLRWFHSAARCGSITKTLEANPTVEGEEPMKMIAASIVMLCSILCASAQEVVPDSTLNEKRVALNEAAVALDASGAPALEASLRTTALNGAPDTPVTNIRMIVRNR